MNAAANPTASTGDAPAAHAPNPAQPVSGAGVDEGEDAADDAAIAAFFAAPQRPADYQLPSHQAQQKGLQVDFVAEAELRTALHAAGVDNALATSLYTVAISAAQQEPTPLSLAADFATGERSLRMEWSDDFDANLKAANAEGRRLFEAMPESVRRGMTYAEYARAAGFANSAPIAKMLLARAQSRSRTSKGGR